MSRKVAVVTGSRAEYGLLHGLMRVIQDDPALELQPVVTGMHLSPAHGFTVQQIEQDGFAIAAKVEMLLSTDTPVGVAKSLGLGVIGFADAFERLSPDVVVLLGDRFEILAAAQAAMIARIPIAHVHGGETTEGAFDEAIRHSITKMAQLHFVAAEPYRRRVIRMGESPERVFTVGSPGLDQLSRLSFLAQADLARDLAHPLASPLFLVTYHPVTLDAASPAAGFGALLDALDAFPEATLLFTKPNADPRAHAVAQMIEAYASQHPGRVVVSPSLGTQRYLSAMRLAAVVVGNSSSGLTEAPALGKATVNIGDRQRGRLRASSVIDAPEQAPAIEQAIRRALSPAFQASLSDVVSPYGGPGASARIVQHLRHASLESIVMKSFHDGEATE